MIIRFCLSVASKSPSVKELRNTKISQLARAHTIRDQKVFVQPKRGFRKKVVDHLIKRTSGFNGADRFLTLLFDEMKVQENMIFVGVFRRN